MELGVIQSNGKGLTVRQIRPLTKVEYNDYKLAVSNLMRIKNRLELFHLVYFNFNDYSSGLRNFENQHNKNPSMGRNMVDTYILHLNRYISNYLSSVKIFLDHTKFELINQYGKNSQQVVDFENVCSDAFDNSFSYRFISRLRNYVQHCGLPVGEMNFRSEMVNNNPNNVRNSLELKFNRDELLNKFNWKKLTPEIKKLPPKFDINPHISNMNESISEIAFSIIKNELPQSIKNSEDIQKLINETKVIKGYPCIILNITQLNDHDFKFTFEDFPLPTIEIVNYFKNMKSDPPQGDSIKQN